jgi:hypothetical protein
VPLELAALPTIERAVSTDDRKEPMPKLQFIGVGTTPRPVEEWRRKSC